jgi:hypothetical protein
MVKYTRKKNIFKRETQRGGSNKKCIFLTLKGGFGNQLFIYSTGLLIKKKTDNVLCLLSDSTATKHSDNYKKIFKEHYENKDNPRINSAEKVTTEDEKEIYNFISKNKHNDIKICTELYFQNYRLVHPVIKGIKKMLIDNEFHKEHYNKFRKMIDCKHSSFFHVRRGDYVEENRLLPNEYFYNGLEILEKNATIKKVYVISDDLKWCKDHDSEFKKYSTKIEYLEDLNELETMYCMMLCEAGAIISNSTFSAWGAMLGADMNKKSTIVYPQYLWGLGDDRNKENPLKFPDRWISFDTMKKLQEGGYKN